MAGVGDDVVAGAMAGAALQPPAPHGELIDDEPQVLQPVLTAVVPQVLQPVEQLEQDGAGAEQLLQLGAGAAQLLQLGAGAEQHELRGCLQQ